MGSFLPSFLIWEAMKGIVEAYGPDCVVYPSLREQPWVDLWLYDKGIRARDVADRGEFLRRYRAVLQIASLPERFTAIVPAEEARDLAEAAVALGL
jgi:CRISPR-associated protein Cmr2